MTIIENMSGQITINKSVLQILVERLQLPVNAATRQRAVLHVEDWLGTAMLGARQPAATGFITASEQTANQALSCTAMSGNQHDWWHALQINAALGNLLEMDDLHRVSILHPGPVIVPAAIAVAEKVGASGEALLTAIVRGYEATIRIGAALGTTHYQYFHNTSTCGTFGAAAAAASLLNLNAAQTMWALANAGSRTGGLWQMRHEACETKSLHNVVAAQTGVQAALLARHHVRGPSLLLEGAQGLFQAMSDGSSAKTNATAVVADLDSDWRIHEVSFKPWPACRHAHPVIDAALAVREKINHRTIAKIDIETYKSAIDFCDKPQPKTEHEAKFSLQHCASVVLMKGKPQLDDFVLSNLSQEAIVKLRNRVVVSENSAMTRQFPNHYQASIRVTFDDGSMIEHMQHDAKGDPELPMTIDEIDAKARMLMMAANVVDVEGLIAATKALDSTALVASWTQHWHGRQHG
jgi:2-methylcitrate dehydratase PrpD